MIKHRIKKFFPSSFFGRAVLILILPVVSIQVVLSIAFIQRHYERVTTQVTSNTALTLKVVLTRLDASTNVEDVLRQIEDILAAHQIGLRLQTDTPVTFSAPGLLDLAGQEIARTLREQLPEVRQLDFPRSDAVVSLWFETRHGLVELTVPRRLLTTSNPHQLLVIVFVASVLMTLIAFQFLRLQIRAISRLGAAADAYGRGENVALHVSGAREIRAAARAFIDMRDRIDQIRGQQQIMLSGVSHDMRTPLTRMRLILSMMEDREDCAAIEVEITELEARINLFLEYAREQMHETEQLSNLDLLISNLVERYHSAGQLLHLTLYAPPLPDMLIKAKTFERALDNLISNSTRYASYITISRKVTESGIEVCVEDNGPGIAPQDRARVCEPFVRLDESRNSDTGGMGLGLAIVNNSIRALGGTLLLDESAALGGLCATLHLPLPSKPAAGFADGGLS